MTIAQEKRELRSEMLKARAAIPAEQCERAKSNIAAQLFSDADVKSAIEEKKPIAVYLSMPEELSLDEFIVEALRKGVRLAAPRWNGERYSFVPLCLMPDGVELNVVTGHFHVREPVALGEEDLVQPAVVILPGLAFSKNGARLGFGGGYYDRLLAELPNEASTIAVAYPCQVVQDLPTEPHDRSFKKLLIASI